MTGQFFRRTVVGFTGSRRGMSRAQQEHLRALLKSALEFHHGDCIGADAMAHITAEEEGAKTVVHPPLNPKLRARCVGDLVLPEKDYIARNHDIVEACDVLAAAPDGPERIRSGTWATIRYARKRGVPVVMLGENDIGE